MRPVRTGFITAFILLKPVFSSDRLHRYVSVFMYAYSSAARVWDQLMGAGDRKGQTPSAADTQIAAVAIDRKLILVTRNVKDFERFDPDVLNPGKDGVED